MFLLFFLYNDDVISFFYSPNGISVAHKVFKSVQLVREIVFKRNECMVKLPLEASKSHIEVVIRLISQ